MTEIFNYNGIILYLLSDENEYKRYNKINAIDNYGYKYLTSKAYIQKNLKQGSFPSRFFCGNPYTEENIKIWLKNDSDDIVEVVDFKDAKKNTDKILLHDKELNIYFERNWSQIISGRYKHSKLKKECYSTEYIKNEMDKLNLILCSEYLGSKKQISYLCKKHIEKGEQTGIWSTIKRSKCPCKWCYLENKSKSIDEKRNMNCSEYSEKMNYIKNPNIDIVGDFHSGRNYKIKCVCKTCGRDIYLTHHAIKRGAGCPNCLTKSIGEDKIYQFLIRNKIYFKKEYKFNDCVNKKELPFDFYIPDLNTVIEFDGVQHFKPVEIFGGKENFEYVRYNDSIKTNYCKEHGINLIRISYKEKDKIDEILYEKLNLN